MKQNTLFLTIAVIAGLLIAYQVLSNNTCTVRNGRKVCPVAAPSCNQEYKEECATCNNSTPDAFRDEIYTSLGRSGHEAY